MHILGLVETYPSNWKNFFSFITGRHKSYKKLEREWGIKVREIKLLDFILDERHEEEFIRDFQRYRGGKWKRLDTNPLINMVKKKIGLTPIKYLEPSGEEPPNEHQNQVFYINMLGKISDGKLIEERNSKGERTKTGLEAL